MRQFLVGNGDGRHRHREMTGSGYVYGFAVLKQEAVMCKHTLAAKLAVRLGLQRNKLVSDADFQVLVCHSEIHELTSPSTGTSAR